MKRFYSFKRLSILNFFMLFTVLAFSQSNSTTDLAFAKKGSTINWIKINPSTNLTANAFFQKHYRVFGLENPETMVETKKETDFLDFTHQRFQQTFNGVPVEGGEYVLHSKNGKLEKANGHIVPNLTLTTVPALTSTQAIERAKEFFTSENYNWENPVLENMLKYSKQDPSATFFPNPELVITDPSYSNNPNNYSLCWKMEIYSNQPLFAKQVFINAHTGEVEFSYDLLHSASGIAITKYSGQQNIVTDSVAPDTFLLRDYTRGKGVETFDMNTKTDNDSAVDFFDTDNYWDTFNAEQDEAATDAHWGTEMTYDYFVQKHNRYSYDGDTSKMISYVHFDLNYVNAFWNGQWSTYGDGNGSSYSPLTTIDIVAHEIAHGVTGNSAKLIYMNESGALNESFSDIFGAMVELFAIPDSFDWYMGEDCHITGNGFRNMANPNEMGDPDTYFGTSWYTGTLDNGGVHTNSGVQNFWFYLLSEGGTGTNDLGNNYAVQALGHDTAAAIAYRNLTVYLTKSSNHFDAREGAIFAAEDLFGACSNEVIQTANAWHAVGVGFPLSDYDIWTMDVLSPNTACGLSNAEPLEIMARYDGCGVTLNAGDKIPFAYSLNNGPAVEDTLTLTSSLAGGDTVYFTFTQPLDVSVVDTHHVDVWSAMPGDTVNYNDTIFGYEFEHILQQNTDVGILRVASPASHCSMSDEEEVSLEIGFYGCDSLPAGTQFDAAFTFNGGNPVQETVSTTSDIFPGDTIFYTFSTTIDVSALGHYPFSVWTLFPGDVDNSNDSVNGILLQNPVFLHEEIITFEDSMNVRDTLVVNVTENTLGTVSSVSPSTGTYSFQITGAGDVRDDYPNFKVPNKGQTWNRYPNYKSELCICVEGGEWSNANLVFDLRQTYAPTHQQVLGSGNKSKYGSSMRVLGDGMQIGPHYSPEHYFNDTFVTHVLNFDTLCGNDFQVCFETRTYFNEEEETVPYGKGDNVFLDNIYFDFVVGIKEEKGIGGALQLYPNPTSDLLNITLNSTENEQSHISVVNMLGQKITERVVLLSEGENKLTINTSLLENGVYIVQLTTANSLESKRFVVEK